jgi:Holliday junction DNA helicase RuvB
MIAATTRVSMISSPLRSRFSGGVFRLEFYNENELSQIIKRSSKLLGTDLEDEAILEIAKRSRFTPRTANYFLKRVRDYAQVYKKDLNKDTVKNALNLLAIDEIGLTASDRKFLEVLIDKFSGGPVGLKTIAAALGEEEETIEEVIEPYLIQLGLIEKTTRGRIATDKAYLHLGFEKINKEN